MAATAKDLQDEVSNASSCKHSRSLSTVTSTLKTAEIPGETKFACQKCTYLNETSATNCACCGCASHFLKAIVEEDKNADTECDSLGDRPVVCQTCNGTFGSMSDGHELLNCKHGFCRPCISTTVGKRLLDLVRSKGTDHLLRMYGSVMQCPVEGCGSTLSRQDLRLVLGESMQGLFDEWVMTSLTHQVVYSLVWCCPNCKDTEHQLLMPPSQFHLLQEGSLRKTFKRNNLTLPHGRRSGKRELVRDLKKGAPLSLLCSCCFFLVCQNCGMKAAPHAGMAHQCGPLQRQCFGIIRSIMKLCSAYIQATYMCKNKRYKKEPRMCNDNGNQQVHGNALTYECLVKWFYDKGFEVMEKEEGKGARGGGSPCRSDASTVDVLAQTALQELESCLSQTLVDNGGALSFVLGTILCSHDLPYKLLKWLVKNDSLMDMADRGDLYWTMLSFLRVVSSSFDLLPLLCSREARQDCMALQSRCDTPGSVMADFKNLFKQAQFMLHRGDLLRGDLVLQKQEKKTRSHAKKKQIEQDCLLPSLVANVIATYELLHKRILVWEKKTSKHPWLASTFEVSRSMAKDDHHKDQLLCANLKAFIYQQAAPPSSRTGVSRVRTRSMRAIEEPDSFKLDEQGEDDVGAKKDKDGAVLPSTALIEAYKEALRPFQFDEACLLPTHYFRYCLRDSEAWTMSKGRARAISEELTRFNTQLPLEWESSIFLRVDEQRSDVLRALIIGPKDTPYENGVFLFDLWLGSSYPDKPPQVQFLTTAGGKVRFNPNLYASGKVCLSLLGTWAGPRWMAGESSIMQVLVSIQALILVADPYYNEPGFEATGNQKDADVYLHNQRMNTVQHSMLPALRSPDMLFLPVIRTHFRLKAACVLHQCAVWMQEESRPDVAELYKQLIDQLRLEIDKLTAADAQP